MKDGNNDKSWVCIPNGIRGGLMVSALDSGPSGLGSSSGLSHYIVYLGKILYSPSASLHRDNKYQRENAGSRVTCTYCDGLASLPRRIAILLSASHCYRNRDKLRQLWATRLVHVKTLPFLCMPNV